MNVLSLAGSRWQFRDTTTKAWLPATVPGCVHTDLQAAGKIPDPFAGTHELDLQGLEEKDWEYRLRFSVPKALAAEKVVELVADGLDTIATVHLNGKKVAATDNMFIAHRWPVKRLLKPGANELRIVFGSAMAYIRKVRPEHAPREINDPVGGCTRIRKEQCQFGWDWGPRFVTAGIWRSLRLEAWSANRLTHVRVAQAHGADGAVTLSLAPELARRDDRARYDLTIALAGRTVLERTDVPAEALSVAIPDPQLWWPAGQGAQPLYSVTLVARSKGATVGSWARRIGLRTVVLDRSPDAWGEAFRFIVNGRPVFMKGANWIPAHAFVAALSRSDYERDLRAAREVNMNMIRVWGGGIYESEDFYDLCDELGLMVWQDFMFACTLYPGDAPFVESVRVEADHQVRRLHHRACLALWCGNNEIPAINWAELQKPDVRGAYERVFHEALPAAVAAHDGVTPYWPSSPWRGGWEHDGSHAAGVARGDTHYWDVWHARHPVKDYEKHPFRFCSEFGMQSYSSPETNATFCGEHEDNIFGPVMENHQKNRSGNQIILDYVSRRYRFPKSQEALIFLSQLNQADCMQIGVEFYRRNMPRSMGALYWQLNDCWPVASWASIEFTGRWKLLHHAARRFFAPALVTAHIDGDETPRIGNYRETTVREVHLYTVYDAPGAAQGDLRWDLFHVDGRILRSGRRSVVLRNGESVRQETLDMAADMAAYGRDELYLRIALDIDGTTASEETVFLSPPRFVDLPRGRAEGSVRMLSPTQALITFVSPVFLYRMTFDLPGLMGSCSQNAFDLYPGEKKDVVVELVRPSTAAQVRKALETRSLVDTYE